ncbi:MAG: hypothetical protein WEB52_15885 [Dehalococcoidia bacterium]
MATELRTEALFDALKQPLGLIDNEERRRHLETYIETARVPLERAVNDLMSQIVQSIDEQVREHFRIRLTYRPGGLALEVEEKHGDGDDARWASLEGDIEKITIRIPAELKDLATQAAQRGGTSANSWFVKALARALRASESGPPPSWGHDTSHHRRDEDRPGRRGSRFSGWVGGDED